MKSLQSDSKRRAASTKLALAGVVALAVAGTVAARAWRRSGDTSTSVAAATAAATTEGQPLRFAWQTGSRYVYALSWNAATRVSTPGIGAGSMDGEAKLAGELSLSAIGQADGATILAASLGNVTDHTLRLMGSDALGDDDAARATFEGRQAWLRVEPSGHVDAVYFKKDESPTFEHLMQSVLEPMEVDLGDGERGSWSTIATTVNGTSSVAYEVTGQSPTTITRTRGRYDEVLGIPGGCNDCAQVVDDRGAITLDPAGFVRSLEERESFDAKRPTDATATMSRRTSFHVTWLRTETFAASSALDLSALEERKPGQVVASQHAKDGALAQRVGSMDSTSLIAGIGAYDASGKLVDPKFVWRASGLVTQHPEVCADLVKAFESAKTGTGGRALVLDVLASAATGPAQAAMREALGSPEATKDRGAYGLLLQRFSVIQNPQPESARFIADAYDRANGHGDSAARSAAAYTLGAMARGLSKGSDPELARDYDAKLVRALADAKTPADKAVYIQALGNAEQPRDRTILRDLAKDGDAKVRAAVAVALRSDTTHDGRATLDALASDSDPNVQELALTSLSRQSLDVDDMRALSTEVTSGSLDPSNEGAMVTFTMKHAQDDVASAKQILAYLLAQAQAREDRTNTVRIRTLLEQLGS